jgi:SPP1 gp7 family putative phage head morphogenesis protein
VTDTLRYDTSPIGPGPNWVTHVAPVEGLGSFVRAVVHALIRDGHPEQEAIQIAEGVMRRWAAGVGVNKHQKHVTPKTQAKAAAALAHWEKIKALAHAESADSSDRGLRDFVGESNSSASDLLPNGIPPSQAKKIDQQLAGNVHAFRGSDLASCSRCGKAVGDPIHNVPTKGEAVPIAPVPREAQTIAAAEKKRSAVLAELATLERSMLPLALSGRTEAVDRMLTIIARRSQVLGLRVLPEHAVELAIERLEGQRHRAPGHSRVPTGHIKGDLHRRRMADKAEVSEDADAVEKPFTEGLQQLFAKQERATLARLRGHRGRQMLRDAGLRADEPTPVPPNASDIFDQSHWTAQTSAFSAPFYQQVMDSTGRRVRGQLARGGSKEPLDDSGSLGATSDILRQRATRMASDVTSTTLAQIQDALAQGYAAGEGIPKLAQRVRDVFADASANRAKTIARTETMGALNQAAQTYAENLPAGRVGRKEWLAHHDERTRHTHRIADGQQVPIHQPYHVGMSLMMFPGDPTAPPDEVINCRCAQAFLPPTHSLSLGGPQP